MLDKCLLESLNPFIPKSTAINSKFPLQPHQKYYVTQYEELGFSSLTHSQVNADYATNSHYLRLEYYYTFLFERWGKCTFELRSERVNHLNSVSKLRGQIEDMHGQYFFFLVEVAKLSSKSYNQPEISQAIPKS